MRVELTSSDTSTSKASKELNQVEGVLQNWPSGWCVVPCTTLGKERHDGHKKLAVLTGRFTELPSDSGRGRGSLRDTGRNKHCPNRFPGSLWTVHRCFCAMCAR